MEVIALRDIHPGEEIVQSYLDASLASTSDERRKRIKDEWSFACTCPICAGAGVAASDDRRRQIRREQERLDAAGSDAGRVLALARGLMRLYEDEDMIVPRADNYWLAAVVANALELDEDSVKYAAAARRYSALVFGEESEEVRAAAEVERDPAGYRARLRAEANG